MNTWVWGPPAWRVLHTLSGKVSAAGASSDFERVLDSLRGALPCVFCRNSWSRFLMQERGVSDPVQKVFNLHSRVSDKLNRQHWEKSGATGRYVAPRAPTLSCIRVKLRTTMRRVCQQDVWSHLEIFAHGSALHEGGRLAFADYCESLGSALAKCGQDRLGPSVRGISLTARAIGDEGWTTSRAIGVVFEAQKVGQSGRESAEDFREILSCVSSVRAGRCAEGSCE